MKKTACILSLLLWIVAVPILCWQLSFRDDLIHVFPKLKSGVEVQINRSGSTLTLVGFQPRYVLRIAKHKMAWVELDVTLFNQGDYDLIEYVRKCHVDETPDGLAFVQPSNVRLFAPREWYEGGR
jgi:hypothetical protein